MPRPTARIAAIAAAALIAAGCGGSSGGGTPENPKDELVAGITALGDADVLTTTLQLDASSADLQAAVKAGGDKLSADDADKITSARVVLETTNDKTFALRAIVGDDTLLELRVVDKALYLHGDVPAALDLFGKADLLAGIKAQTAQLPPFVGAFIDGKWISLDADALKSFAGQLGATTNASPDAAAGRRLLNDLKGAVQRDITVKRTGSDSAGDHLELSGDVRDLARDLKTAIQNNIPGGAAIASRLDTSTIKSRTLVVGATVNDGAVTQLSLDLAQFDDDGKLPSGTSLPIVLNFERSGDDITAPSGAVQVDLNQLGTMLGAVLGGSV